LGLIVCNFEFSEGALISICQVAVFFQRFFHGSFEFMEGDKPLNGFLMLGLQFCGGRGGIVFPDVSLLFELSCQGDHFRAALLAEGIMLGPEFVPLRGEGFQAHDFVV
jgi:hypothetical protein